MKKTSTTKSTLSVYSTLFNSEARKTFVEGILQDIKGYLESKTDGLVEVTYENYDLKNHEFGFKLFVEKRPKCKKQQFFDVASAAINIINYMFPGNSEQYEITVISEDNKLEFEFVSNW